MTISKIIMPSDTAIERLLSPDTIQALHQPTTLALGLPAEVYFDPSIFKLECERLFPTTWVAAGVASDIPEVGDATPATVAGRSIIFLRDKDHQIRAFYNACRHRGMQLLCQPAKGLRHITCPFHHWTYDLDGSLRGTPYLGGIGKHELEGFEPEKLGLIEIKTGEWCNTLFVNLDGKAPTLKQHLAPLIDHLGGQYDWNKLYRHPSGSIKEENVPGNWKEYVEVSLEEYHLRFAHPHIFEDIDSSTWRNTPVTDHHLFGSQAFLSGSFGAGYKFFSGTPLPCWRDRGNEWQSYVTLFPNLGIWATSDQLSIDFAMPTSEDCYHYRQEFYFANTVSASTIHKEAIEAALSAWARLMVEDSALLAGLRNTQKTNHYIRNRVRFAGAWEVNIQRFQQYYLKSLLANH